jgi:hypothetical protein
MDAIAVTDIKSRRDFHDAFQAAMSGAYDTLRAFWHFERGQNLPKSYLIEFHPAESSNHKWGTDDVFAALKRATKRYQGEVGKTEDDGLLWLQHSERPDRRADFVVDCLNPRFLIFHTLSNVEYSDHFIVKRLTQYQPEFDLFWLPVSLLERTETRERINAWEAQFMPLIDSDLLPQGESETSELDLTVAEQEEEEDFDHFVDRQPPRSPKRTNIGWEHQHAFEAYKKLKERPDLLPDLPLNAVLAERCDEDGTSYARARITSHGKITGRGPDFSSYLQIVDGTLDDYAKVVEGLESKYWLEWAGGQLDDRIAISIKGKPFCIKFSREIDVRRLVKLMFDCGRAFRLMGEVDEIDEDYFAVEAVDLHINQPVAFEIAPRFMRIYLYEGTCGNTLVRIIRSLQHSVDSKLSHASLI